jgi:serine/threonine kinase 3
MIPAKPPPSFSKPDLWSPQFIDFVTCCLVKNQENRANVAQLLQHEFIQDIQSKPPGVLDIIIREAKEMRMKIEDENATVSEGLS